MDKYHFQNLKNVKRLLQNMLGCLPLQTWKSTADDNHNLNMQVGIQEYKTTLSQIWGLTTDEADRAISFLYDLAQIQKPSYAINNYFSNVVEVCLNGDGWPVSLCSFFLNFPNIFLLQKWLMEKCALPRPRWAPDTNKIFVYDSEFMYAIESLLERHAPVV